MSAVDDFIANLQQYRASADSAPMVGDIDLFIAALQLLQSQSTSQSGIWSHSSGQGTLLNNGSASAATMGIGIRPISNFTIDKIITAGNWTNGHQYKLIINTVDGTPNILTQPYSQTFIAAGSLQQTNILTLTAPFIFLSGTSYIVSLTDINLATGGTNIPISCSSAGTGRAPNYTNLPIDPASLLMQEGWKLASLAPTVGNTFLTSTLSPIFSFHVIAQ